MSYARTDEETARSASENQGTFRIEAVRCVVKVSRFDAFNIS